MYADPVSGEWTWAEDVPWFAGFWGGTLWLAAAATGEEGYLRAAHDVVRRLRPRASSPTILRGFMFWYGAGLGSELGEVSDDIASAAVSAGRSLAENFDAVAGLLPPGEEDAALYGWPSPGACVDGMPGAGCLLAFASRQTGDPRLRDLAVSHARETYRMCARTDGSVAQCATYDAAGRRTALSSPNGSSPKTSTWSRAQAWAMLGLPQAAQLSPELRGAATQAADWYLAHVPEDLVCYWDFDDPEIPRTERDTSASAIAAAALIKLAPMAGERYRTAARHTLAALAGEHLGPAGGLIDGCYRRHKGLATHNELIWGDYFMLEATLALAGAIDSSRI
jgi:unsaturated chondroitin disaccharide hydrolase